MIITIIPHKAIVYVSYTAFSASLRYREVHPLLSMPLTLTCCNVEICALINHTRWSAPCPLNDILLFQLGTPSTK